MLVTMEICAQGRVLACLCESCNNLKLDRTKLDTFRLLCIEQQQLGLYQNQLGSAYESLIFMLHHFGCVYT